MVAHRSLEIELPPRGIKGESGHHWGLNMAGGVVTIRLFFLNKILFQNHFSKFCRMA